ncbi:MAG: hypothetical protein M3312_05875, partial [Actinomycetota bacterium]|nr:hypothetical protein [Actinomycetota bacterium]
TIRPEPAPLALAAIAAAPAASLASGESGDVGALALAANAALGLSLLLLALAIVPWGAVGRTSLFAPVAARRFEIGSAGAAILAGLAVAYLLGQQ